MLAQSPELFLSPDTWQEDSMLMEDLRPAEVQRDSRCPGVGEPRTEFKRIKKSKFFFPAQRDVSGNEAALHRVNKSTHRLQAGANRQWHVHAQLRASLQDVVTCQKTNGTKRLLVFMYSA